MTKLKFLLAAAAALVAVAAQGQVRPFGYLVDSLGTPLKTGVYSDAQLRAAPAGVAAFNAAGTLLDVSGNAVPIGTGSVTSVSVITANGVSGTVATATTTPALSLTLGAITPTSVNGNTITAGTGTLTLGSATLNAGAGGTLGSNAFNSTAFMTNPMTTGGDIIYGGASGAPTRLANGTAGQVLTSAGTTLAPTWTTLATGAPALTDTRIAFGSAGNVMTSASGFTYSGGTVLSLIDSNSPTQIRMLNQSTGTSAAAVVTAQNCCDDVIEMRSRSNNYSLEGGGLMTARVGSLTFGRASGGSSHFVIGSITPSQPIIFTTAGVGTGNEVMRLLAGGGATFSASSVQVASISSAGIISDARGDVRSIIQNSRSADYTTVLTDCGKHILHPSADTTARIFTIDSNANVAAPIGCMITFVNQNAGGVVTVAITSDTMRLAGAGTTGSRTMAANCVATALKIVATEWIISGGSCLT